MSSGWAYLRIVLQERRKAQLLIFFESLCFAFLIQFFQRCLGRRLVLCDAEVVCQLLRRIEHGQTVELGCEVDHVPMLAASVAMVVVIVHKQARMSVIVERTECFSMVVDLHALPCCRFSCVDACLYCCEYIHSNPP